MGDYYKHYCETVEPIDRDLYKKIITEFHEGVVDLFLNKNLQDYQMPRLGFIVTIRKRKPTLSINDEGKLVDRRPVDWGSTLKLWDRDPESKEKKILIRHKNSHTGGYVFSVRLKRFKSKLRNGKYFKFRGMRNLTRGMSNRIKDKDKDNFDSYSLYSKQYKGD